MTGVYRLHGTPGSLYTAKARSYLIKQGLPFENVAAGEPSFRETIVPRIGRWIIPVVETPAIAEGTALIGAFGTGAQLYDREQASIRISEQHADFFVRNAIVILAEQRLAPDLR